MIDNLHNYIIISLDVGEQIESGGVTEVKQT